MSRVTLNVELVEDDMETTREFTIQLRHTDKIVSTLRGSRDLSNYDFFHQSKPIYPEDTPLSLHMKLFDKVDAYRIATKKEVEEMTNHLRKCKLDPSKFKMYCGGDMAICDMGRLPPPIPAAVPIQTHKWGKGRKLGNK